MNYELVEVQNGEVPHEALNIAESLGIDEEWINNAKESLNLSNSSGLELEGSNSALLGKVGGE